MLVMFVCLLAFLQYNIIPVFLLHQLYGYRVFTTGIALLASLASATPGMAPVTWE